MRPPAPQNQSSSPPRSVILSLFVRYFAEEHHWQLLLVRRDLRKQTDEQGIKQSVVGGGDDPLWPLSAMDPEDKKKLYNLSSLDKRMVESSVKDEFAYITYLAYPLFDNKVNLLISFLLVIEHCLKTCMACRLQQRYVQSSPHQ